MENLREVLKSLLGISDQQLSEHQLGVRMLSELLKSHPTPYGDLVKGLVRWASSNQVADAVLGVTQARPATADQWAKELLAPLTAFSRSDRLSDMAIVGAVIGLFESGVWLDNKGLCPTFDALFIPSIKKVILGGAIRSLEANQRGNLDKKDAGRLSNAINDYHRPPGASTKKGNERTRFDLTNKLMAEMDGDIYSPSLAPGPIAVWLIDQITMAQFANYSAIERLAKLQICQTL